MFGEAVQLAVERNEQRLCGRTVAALGLAHEPRTCGSCAPLHTLANPPSLPDPKPDCHSRLLEPPSIHPLTSSLALPGSMISEHPQSPARSAASLTRPRTETGESATIADMAGTRA